MSVISPPASVFASCLGRAGVPRIVDVETLVQGPEFAQLAHVSDAFRSRNAAALAGYARRWVADPLRGWSRRWEYPFVLAWLQCLRQETAAPGLRLLDAGSGATYFPFHVASRWPGASVHCVDSDPELESVYRRIQDPAAAAVRFTCGRLQELPAEDAGIDGLYCISVLEHTGDDEAVLREFGRVLRPGGLLIVTFDISRDGRTDVAPDRAVKLLETIGAEFEPVAAPRPSELIAQAAAVDALTTTWARRVHPESVPWRRTWRSSLGALKRLSWPSAVFFDCTVCCTVHRRPHDD